MIPGLEKRGVRRASGCCTATPTSTRRRTSTASGGCAASRGIFFAGQITGVEGYVESAATGLAVGLTLAQMLEGREPRADSVHDGDRLARAALLGAAAVREVRADERDVRPDRGHLALARSATSRSAASRSSDARPRGDPRVGESTRKAQNRSPHWRGEAGVTGSCRPGTTSSQPGAPRRRRAPHARPDVAPVRRGRRAPRSSSRPRTSSAAAPSSSAAPTTRSRPRPSGAPFRAVVAFSSGNHAQAVALVSRMLGIRATIVMPEDAPQAKIAATRGYGAEVVLYDRATREPRRDRPRRSAANAAPC